MMRAGNIGAAKSHHQVGAEKTEQLDRIAAEMLQENLAMQALAKKLGFRMVTSDDPALVRAVLNL